MRGSRERIREPEDDYSGDSEASASEDGTDSEGSYESGDPDSDREATAVVENPSKDVLVSFDSSTWASFLNLAVQDVCGSLDVDMAATMPRCELSKLLLIEHRLDTADLELIAKPENTFATMIVTLPSSFTGGVASLAHAGRCETINQSDDSLQKTSVIAWFTDVRFVISDIQSGARFALLYNLVKTTSFPRPIFQEVPGPIRKIQHILRSWRQSLYAEGTPEKILYLLERKYSPTKLQRKALKGKDAEVVAALGSVCNRLKFRLGLAFVGCFITGGAEIPGAGHGGRWYDDSSDDVDPDYLEFDGSAETTISITNLVTLDGEGVTDDEFELTDKEIRETGFIPRDLLEQVENEDPYDESYEGRDRYDGSRTLSRWHRRAVLVIWPEELHEAFMEGDAYPDYVLQTLAEPKSMKSTKTERRLVEYALGLTKRDPIPRMTINVLRTICATAHHWEDSQPWSRAMEACDGSSSIDRLGQERYLEAVVRLDLTVVVPWIQRVLERDPSNKARLELLECLEERLKATGRSTEWIDAARNSVLASLRPLVVDDCSSILKAVRATGDASALEYRILPQLKKDLEHDSILAMSLVVHAEMDRLEGSIFQSAEEKTIGTRFVAECLATALEHSDLFFQMPPKQPSNVQAGTPQLYAAPRIPYASPDPAMSLIKACMTTGNLTLIDQVVDKLLSGPTSEPRLSSQNLNQAVLLPLIRQLDALMGSQEPSYDLQARIRPLHKAVLPDILEKRGLTEENIKEVLRLAVRDSNIDVLTQSILPRLLGRAHSLLTIRTVVCQLTVLGKEVPSAASALHDVSIQMTRHIVASVPSSMLQSRSNVLELLDFCANNNAMECSKDLIDKVGVEVAASTPERLAEEYFPLIKHLNTWLSRRGRVSTSQPFAKLSKSIIMYWTRRVLGVPKDPKTGSAIEKWLCRCATCTTFIRWLEGPSQERLVINNLGSKTAQHFDAHLQAYAAGIVTRKAVTGSFAITVHIAKSATILNYQRWEKRQRAGIAAIRAISTDESALLDVFREDYPGMLRAMNVPFINSHLPEPAPEPSASVSPANAFPQVTASGSNTLSPVQGADANLVTS
ncbi:hypothetical protein FRB90_007520 [Tulasnella sp. 427]|nr:hypothetical protein FRB90_007520 [Tulasnella sp. 427]